MANNVDEETYVPPAGVPDPDEEQRPPVTLPPNVAAPAAPSVSTTPVPTTPWSTIETAAGQLRAGQPVTALPRTPWSPTDWAGWQARQADYDRRVAAAQADRESQGQMAEFVRLNAGAKDAGKAIEAGVRLIALRGYARDIASGIPIEKVMTKWGPSLFFNNPAAIGPAIHAVTPPPVAHVVTDPGTGLRAWAGGTGIRPIAGPEAPLSTKTTPITDPSGKVIGQSIATSGKGRRILPPAKEGALTDVEKAQLRTLDNEAHTTRMALPLRTTHPDYIAGTNRLAQIQLERDKILYPERAKAAPKQAAGTRDDPAKPITKTELAALASGTYFINPKDGKLLRKK